MTFSRGLYGPLMESPVFHVKLGCVKVGQVSLSWINSNTGFTSVWIHMVT